MTSEDEFIARLMDVRRRDAVAVDGRCYGVGRMEDVDVGRWMLKDLTSEVAVGLDDVDLPLDVGGCREAVQYCRRRCGRW